MDLSFEIGGEVGTTYRTSFVARDLVAETSIPMRTLQASDESLLAVTNALKPGVYKWLWNASVDLPSGFVGERMTIEGNVE